MSSKGLLDNLAILTDVDMTLLPSMSTDTTDEKKIIVSTLHQRLSGAFAFVTGRPAHSLDTSFPAKLPASVEHHAAWRPSSNDGFKPLAPILDSDGIAAFALREIASNLDIFSHQSEVLGDKPGVFIEKKNHSVALVFAARATPQAGRDLLNSVAQNVLTNFGLHNTHRISIGRDAVEVVPVGLSKADAVRHFMDTDAFRGKTPIFLGDGLPDTHGMKVCADEFGGYGIAVGSGIPDAPYIRERVNGIDEVWNYLRKLAYAPR